MKSYSVHIKGKVQGVFFRASTKEQADALGITGFVRNEEDGSVYIEAAGSDDAIEAFLRWCRQGPPRARVDHCEVNEVSFKDFSSFEIQR
ncbi:MAG TPA: acylphosphatase [Chryseosolibacter sp.]|nr:acylphosphatase [Chryseosolibacter sp.]